MKNLGKWGVLAFILFVGVAIFVAIDFGEKSPIYMSGEVHLDPSLTEDAKGINTLFISLYDPASQMPRPYGAVRYTLSGDPQGKFYDFIITKEILNVMSPDLPLPKVFRVKARLDRDGAAGMDQESDLVGELDNVALGSQGIKITIDHKI